MTALEQAKADVARAARLLFRMRGNPYSTKAAQAKVETRLAQLTQARRALQWKP